MDALSEIKKSIKQIAGRNSGYFYTAKVESVDGEVCSVTIDTITLNDVRLRAVINGENSKMLITPKVGSYVLVADLSGGNMTFLAVISYSEIDKITIDCNDKIVINGGENAGLVKIEELQQKLKDLESKFNQHTHTLLPMVAGGIHQVQGGSMVEGSFVPGVAGTMATTNLSTNFQSQTTHPYDYENDKIQH